MTDRTRLVTVMCRERNCTEHLGVVYDTEDGAYLQSDCEVDVYIETEVWPSALVVLCRYHGHQAVVTERLRLAVAEARRTGQPESVRVDPL